MADRNDERDKATRDMRQRVVLPAVLGLAFSVGTFVFTFSRVSSQQGQLSAVSGAAITITTLAGLFVLLFAFSVLTQGLNHRLAARLQTERDGSVAVGVNLTGPVKRILRQSFTEAGDRAQGRPPTLVVFIADHQGIEIHSGGGLAHQWLGVDWEQVAAIEAGKVLLGARSYNGLIIRFVARTALQPVEVIMMRPGIGAWLSVGSGHAQAKAEEITQLKIAH